MADNNVLKTPAEATRRSVLRGALLTGAVMPALAACGADDDTSSPSGKNTPDQSGSAPDELTKSDKAPAGGGEVIASTDDVPEGGGLIVEDSEIVITQPKAGTFLGFTSICTHQGCQVSEVADGSIDCNCHGSKFSIEDGSVVGGPAPSPLPEKQVTVTGSDITLA